ncbi:MAG: M48 family metalloprotease [Alphaproteobacteria bacterium]|nr:M48 family metalloprotease [Alphaproteobacteria bacterium]MBL0718223.1 M48 family metalloprotease [Alphaproteobacteria bacterium]
MSIKKYIFAIYISTFFSFLLPISQTRASVIRLITDTQTEALVRNMIDPLLAKEGLIQEQIDIYIVADNSLNAFVAGGLNIFVTTGLFLELSSYSEVQGVLAHELGHIAGGHLSKRSSAMKDEMIKATIFGVLSLGVGVIAGEGKNGIELGTAGLLAAPEFARKNMMSFSRTAEYSADTFGLYALAEAGISSRGLIKALRKINKLHGDRERRRNIYNSTHPFSEDRILQMEQIIADNPELQKGRRETPDETENFEMVKAKIQGFFLDKDRWKKTDHNDITEIWFNIKNHNGKMAVDNCSRIVKDKSSRNYAFLLEACSRAYYELGQFKTSLKFIDSAIDEINPKKYPNTKKTQLIQFAGIVAFQNDEIDKAIRLLKYSLTLDKNSPRSWLLLAQIYGSQKNTAMQNYSFAEYFYSINDLNKARQFAKKAIILLDENTAESINLKDILTIQR